MAKKKGKKKKYKKSKKKARRSGPKAIPLGSTAGSALYVLPAAQKVYASFKTNGLTYVPEIAVYELSGYSLANKAFYMPKTTKVATPLIGGMLISAAPRLPLVKLVAKPVNRELKRLTKGKVSL